jgi:hypothetical protein
MATAALVDKDLDIGREILRALAKGRIEVTVAFWAYVPQSGEWQLFIATPLVDSKGPRAAYEEVLDTLHDAKMDPYLPWRKLFLRSPKDPVLKSLDKQKGLHGSIDIVESENIPRGTPSAYYVTYVPYSDETLRTFNEAVGDRFVEEAYVYGKTWVVTGLDRLRELLSKFLHVKQDVMESVVEELSTRKSASIRDVQLQPRDLKRLRPA